MLPVIVAAVLIPGVLPQAEAAVPKAVVIESEFHFGRVVRGTVVRHEFVVENRGSAPLVITRIALTAPLVADRLPRIEPGKRGSIPVRLDSSAVNGPFQGELILFTNDPATPQARASFVGEVFDAVELSPLPAFFVATTRSTPKEQSIDIINHEPQPLRIVGIEHSAEFATKLHTIEDGRRYRLTLLMPGTGPGGKHTERIVVRTSSLSRPVIYVPANTWLRERVYTFPDDVDFGAVAFQKVQENPELLGRLTQTLMVYQTGGKTFDIKAHTDMPEVAIAAERGPQGDRWQLTLRLRKGVRPGAIKGSILIETSDPEFKTLTVPVRCVLFEN